MSNGISVEDALLEVEVGHVDLGPHPRGITVEDTRACVGYARAHLPATWRNVTRDYGPRLVVGKTALKTIFYRHITESKIKNTSDAEASMLLLAVYGIECGLKSLLLKRWRMNTTAELEPEYLTHDLNFLANEYYRRKLFPEQMSLESKETVAIVRLHEALRYGLRLEDESRKKITKATQRAVQQIEESLGS